MLRVSQWNPLLCSIWKIKFPLQKVHPMYRGFEKEIEKVIGALVLQEMVEV